jgi:hypothetical protein
MAGIARGFHLRACCLPVDTLRTDCDRERAFRAFLEEGAVRFLLMLVGVSVEELHVAGAKDFETVMKVCAGCQSLGSETGTGIVNLEKTKRLVGVIAYSGFDVVRVAAGEAKEREKREDAKRTHKD